MRLFSDDPDAEYLYRYDDMVYSGGLDLFDELSLGSSRVKVVVTKYKVLKRTPKGAWIHYYNGNGDKKFVRLTARKQFACNTREEALESFLFRKKRQESILASRLNKVRDAIDIVNRRLNSSKKSSNETQEVPNVLI